MTWLWYSLTIVVVFAAGAVIGWLARGDYDAGVLSWPPATARQIRRAQKRNKLALRASISPTPILPTRVATSRVGATAKDGPAANEAVLSGKASLSGGGK